MIATDNSTVVSYINKQGGTHSPTLLRLTVELLWLDMLEAQNMVDSRASPLVRGSEHNSPSKAYPRLSDRDSRPPISSEPANTDRVVPTPRDHEAYLQGLGDTRSRYV